MDDDASVQLSGSKWFPTDISISTNTNAAALERSVARWFVADDDADVMRLSFVASRDVHRVAQHRGRLLPRHEVNHMGASSKCNAPGITTPRGASDKNELISVQWVYFSRPA